ncbi:YadA-like family protein [Psychrobacter maritimus]|uniref:YadA-like family protein n=2 Tax=Psychrobacter TaxID=497 RepID=UPI00248BF24D|nr:YadA-like family protein [Psychrobacter sp. WB2]WGV13969.1 YadA-like family protein [Psychrobacter sp. WB2]
MNRNYKVIWNASLNCFMAVSEYAKARGKSSKSSVSANATINTTSNLSSTNAFRLTAIGLGLGLLAAGFSIPASANNGTSNHHDGTYSHSHGSHGTHTHTNGNNSHNNPNGPGNSGSSISLNFEGDNSTTITRTNGQTLNILGGASGDLTTNNIGVFGSGDSLHIQLAENLTGLTSVTTGNSLLNTSGLAITGGPTFTKARVDVAGNKITGVASGVGNDSNAANIGDLNNAVAANKTKYYSVKNTSAAAATGPGSNVNNDGATKPNAMAMGVNASATGGQAIAIGSGDSGQNTTASGEQSIAIGANVVSSGASSIAIGGDDLDDASKVNGVNALFNTYTGSIGGLVTVGDYSDHTESGGAASVAIGVKAHSKGNLSTAVGVRSSSSGDASSAFGMGSSASQNGSVALGAGSVANRAGGFAAYTGGATGNALTAINSTIGRAELGAVSVGPGGEKGTRQIINVAAGSFDSDAVNVAQLKGGISSVIDLGFDITADNASLAPGETKDKVKLGETVKYTSADGSIVTTVADNEINFALGDNLSVGGSGQDGEDGVDGFIGVNGADGQSGIALNGANGTIGLTGPTGASGIIGVIDGVPGVNGVDGITRIVIDDIQVATMEDGMKFEGHTGDTIAKKLNQTLNIEGTLADSADASGANLRVDSDGSKLNLVMAKNLTDLDSIMINNGGPIISRTGIDMGPVDANSYPTNRITNLGKGIAGTDAVNRDQLDELTTDLTDLGLNFGGDSGDPVNLKLGQKLMVKGGDTINADPATKNISVTANGADTLTVRLAKDINLGKTGSVTTGDTQVNNAGITLYRGDNGQVVLTNNGLNNGNNKITNVADGLLSTTSKDAVNGSQLFKTNEDVAKGIKIGDGNSANDQQFALGDTINVTGDNNITTIASATGVQVKLNNQLNLGDEGRMQMGNSIMNNTGFTFVGNEPGRTVILGAGGLNNGFNRITNVAAGIEFTDAATVGQLKATTFALDRDRALSAQGDKATMVKQGSAFDLNSRDGNIKISRTAAASSVGRAARAVDPNDMTFDLNRDIAVDSVKTGNSTLNNEGLSIVGGPSVKKAGINAADTKITNVVSGEVAANSKDAINGGQLYAQGMGISSIIGGNTTYDPATGTFTNNNIGGTGEGSIDGAIASIKRGEVVMTENIQTNTTNIATNTTNIATNTTNITKNTADIVTNTANITTNTSNIKANKDKIDAGLNFGADSGAVINKPIGDGSVLSFKGGNNIKTTAEGSSIKFDLNGNINVESVTTGNTTVNNSGVTIKNGPSMTAAGIYAGNAETAPSMTAAGINAAGTKVTNIADGMAPRDAVNFGQLDAVSRGLGNSINELGYKIGEVEDDANAGISAAMAMSSLPQAFISGKPMIGGGIATYNGESAVAIGFSKMSNDGRWVMKLNGTADTQGNVGAAIGAGFHFD